MKTLLPFVRSLMPLAAAALVACGETPVDPTGGGGGGTTTTTASSGGGGSGGTGAEGGAGGTGAEGGGGQGGTGGGMVCEPGSQLDCYDGPAATLDVGPCKGGKQTCNEDGIGYGQCEGQVVPLEEDCTTAEDDDCDGEANQESAGCVCFPGETMDCYEGPPDTLGKGLCVGGTSTCAADGLSWGACEGQVVPVPETCDTAGDDDCDGAANEDGAGCSCVPGAMSACYSGPPSTLNVGPCKGGVQVCNEEGTGFGACMGEVTPAAETCNTPVDDDCDGATNESGVGCVCLPNAVDPCYTGPAGTAGVGACSPGTAMCNDQGTAYGPCAGDVTPVAETCNTPVDDDCDGALNESGVGCVCLPGSMQACYTGPAGTSGVGICAPGMQTCNSQGTAYGPCMGQVTPGTESCATAADDDCDGTSNEGCPTITYSADVQPIFQMYCGTCHTGGGSGGHNIGTSYSDTQLASYHCPGKTKGECALVRIQEGSMPLGGGPAPNAAEQGIIQAWIAGGMLP